MDLKKLTKLAEVLDNKDKQELILFLQSRSKGTTAPIRLIDGYHLSNSNVLCTDSWRAFSSCANQKGLEHYLAWFRYLDSKDYENTTSNKKNTLVSSCLFSVKDTNSRLRRMVYCGTIGVEFN